jgi:hypothetical protein
LMSKTDAAEMSEFYSAQTLLFIRNFFAVTDQTYFHEISKKKIQLSP